MNKILKEILVGSLLVDASIKRSFTYKAYITFEQSAKKSEYLNYLFTLCKNNGLALQNDSVTTYSRNDQRYGVTNSSLYFRSESLEELKPHIHDSMLYKVNLERNFAQDSEGFISDSDITTDIDIFDV